MTYVLDSNAGDRLRHANDVLLGMLDGSGWEGPIAFFCECGGAGCYRTVWLTAEDYRAGRDDARWRPWSDRHDVELSGRLRARARQAIDRLALQERREYACASCGYGSVGVEPPSRCPMCGGTAWLHRSPVAA